MIKTVQDEMREATERIHALVALAEKDDRDFSDEEKVEVEALRARMQALDGKRRRGESFADLLANVGKLAPPAPKPNGSNGNGTAHPATGGPNPYAPTLKSLGQQFIESDVYATLRAMPRTGQWQTPVVELDAAVTINPPGTLVPPGTTIVPFVSYPDEWGVADLFAQGSVDGGMVSYLQETAFTNAAAPVAPGAAKPESTKTFLLVQQGLVKIAHWIPVPDEFLDDIAGFRSFLDAQMMSGVTEALNNQLINGSGTGGNMMGIIPLPGKAPTIAVPATPGVGVPAAAVAAQRAQVYALSRLRPDAVVMNPMTWAGLSAGMSTAGGYLAGPNTFGAGVPPQVWGLRVVETPEVPDGTAIVGAFRQGGQLFRKGGVSVQASNSHADFFIRNTTAIRAETRAALALYRPLAFGLITGIPVADTTP